MRVRVNRLKKASDSLMEVTPLSIGPLHENLSEGYYFFYRLVAGKKKRGGSDFKVGWKGYKSKYDTWEPEVNLPPLIVDEYHAMIRAKGAHRDA